MFQAKTGTKQQKYLARGGLLLHNAGDMLQATDVTGDLLKAVSRSFYLTIRFLPMQMRPAIALGYMLARATDSVADTSSAEAQKRVEVLHAMAAVIAGHSEQVPALMQVLQQEIAPGLSHESEKTLLCEFAACLQALETFDAVQRALIRKVLSIIIEGQVWDLVAFGEHHTVQNDEETHAYTYRVAGCVGEFWTDLGYATMGEAFCTPARRELMTQAGIRYGKGLQLINILRDMEEDAARGRCYLCSDPDKWLNRAERYMNDGLDYSRRLGTFKLRFASMLPALIGKKTIQLLRKTTLGHGKVKIKRFAVYVCLLKAVFLSLRGKA